MSHDYPDIKTQYERLRHENFMLKHENRLLKDQLNSDRRVLGDANTRVVAERVARRLGEDDDGLQPVA